MFNEKLIGIQKYINTNGRKAKVTNMNKAEIVEMQNRKKKENNQSFSFDDGREWRQQQ